MATVQRFSRVSRSFSALCAGLAMLGLAGCNGSGLGGIGNSVPQTAPRADNAPVVAPGAPLPTGGDAIGSGPVKVALIAPLTQNGQPSQIGVSLRNAVELAIIEAGGSDITVLVKDDQSTAAGAQAAAQGAINEGAELLIGPLFGGNVREAGRIARASGKPVIGFSTDAAVASHGVYLLSFMVESYVDRIIDFASSKNKKSIAALIPENDYGNVALAAFQTAAARNGLRVMAVERYRPGAAKEAIGRIAQLGGQIDALFIPEQADAMGAVARDLAAAKIANVQILGTGLWNDARVLKLPALQGAWFSAPENTGFNAFAQRYRAKFNADPTRLATLAYDATTLAIALARGQGGQRYSESVLTNPSGFTGADGVFRFRSDGLNERGLSVLQINNGSATVVSPAPRSFAGAPS